MALGARVPNRYRLVGRLSYCRNHSVRQKGVGSRITAQKQAIAGVLRPDWAPRVNHWQGDTLKMGQVREQQEKGCSEQRGRGIGEREGEAKIRI